MKNFLIILSKRKYIIYNMTTEIYNMTTTVYKMTQFLHVKRKFTYPQGWLWKCCGYSSFCVQDRKQWLPVSSPLSPQSVKRSLTLTRLLDALLQVTLFEEKKIITCNINWFNFDSCADLEGESEGSGPPPRKLKIY